MQSYPLSNKSRPSKSNTQSTMHKLRICPNMLGLPIMDKSFKSFHHILNNFLYRLLNCLLYQEYKGKTIHLHKLTHIESVRNSINGYYPRLGNHAHTQSQQSSRNWCQTQRAQRNRRLHNQSRILACHSSFSWHLYK